MQCEMDGRTGKCGGWGLGRRRRKGGEKRGAKIERVIVESNTACRMNDDGAAHVVKTHGLVHGAGSPIEGCNAPGTRPGQRVLAGQWRRGMVGVASNSRAVWHRQM